MSIGYTLSHRAKWENPIFRNLLEAGIWAWMCDTAVWKEAKIRFNGELVTLQRGQLITSRRFISEGFCVGEQVTRTFLENLENDGMINQQLTHRGTLITICNYDKYQQFEILDNPQTNQQPTSSQPAANPNKKQYKENKEDNNIYAERFLEFWEVYPRKINKAKAEKIFYQLLKKGIDHETIITGARNYNEETRGTEERYIAHATTWLNGERWKDEKTKLKKLPTLEEMKEKYL